MQIPSNPTAIRFGRQAKPKEIKLIEQATGRKIDPALAFFQPLGTNKAIVKNWQDDFLTAAKALKKRKDEPNAQMNQKHKALEKEFSQSDKKD